MPMKYVMEPFKIKMVEMLKQTTREERLQVIKEAHYNMFGIPSEYVSMDMLTDSGTGAMSDRQWAAMMTADESYGGARGYKEVCAAVQDIFGYRYAQPVHQGRAAEKVLFGCLMGPGDFAIANTFFDTTHGHVVMTGARPINCACSEAADIFLDAPFKGNMDVAKLEQTIIEKGADKVKMILMTITNNSAGGQPVSAANLRETGEIAKKYGIPFVIDAARFAENAYFIKAREAGYENKSIREIIQEVFACADAFTMSAKKDAVVNMGGLIGIREDESLMNKVRLKTIPLEGFLSYGGLSGRDIAALAVGLYEGIEEAWLRYRVGQVQYLGELLHDAGIPIQYPVGGHGIYIDCGVMMPHLAWDQFPAQAVTVALFLEGGIRGCDIGSLCLDRDPDTNKQQRASNEWCRLCMPRRVMTQSQIEFVAETIMYVRDHAEEYPGFRIIKEAPILRHFTVELEPLPGSRTL